MNGIHRRCSQFVYTDLRPRRCSNNRTANNDIRSKFDVKSVGVPILGPIVIVGLSPALAADSQVFTDAPVMDIQEDTQDSRSTYVMMNILSQVSTAFWFLRTTILQLRTRFGAFKL